MAWTHWCNRASDCSICIENIPVGVGQMFNGKTIVVSNDINHVVRHSAIYLQLGSHVQVGRKGIRTHLERLSSQRMLPLVTQSINIITCLMCKKIYGKELPFKLSSVK